MIAQKSLASAGSSRCSPWTSCSRMYHQGAFDRFKAPSQPQLCRRFQNQRLRRLAPLSASIFPENEFQDLNSSTSTDWWGGEDFYTILGVAPNADSKDIRRAYHQLMREFHPDLSSDVKTTDFCALINEIYTTLSDPESRATYDALAGFSVESINPFTDKSFPVDQVFVDELNCIGCGKCVRQCPATFYIEASLYGRARVVRQGADAPDEVQVAIETCPVDCIHWVTSPQLSLLEAALSGMERVDVWVMMRNFRSPGDVFELAGKAWRKRQAAIRARLEQHGPQTGWTFFNQFVDMRDQQPGARSGAGNGADPGSAYGSPAGKRIANLAAAAARAARMWRMYSDVVKEQRVLCD